MKKYNSIQVLRGFAALFVVIHHSALSINAFIGSLPEHVSSFFTLGYLGVDLFFVLSGFIILNSHYNDEKSFFSLKKYGVKRFSRIWPPYIIISTTMIILYFVFSSLSQGYREGFSFISSIFLLPSSYPPALSVSWTLIHEVFFYFLFCIFFFSSVYFCLFIFFWLVGIVLIGIADPSIKNIAVLNYYFGFINIEFIFGMITCLILKLVKKIHIRLFLCLFFILAGVLLFLFFPLNNDSRAIASLFFSSLLILSITFEDYFSITNASLFVILGDASYSIYLIHNPLISLTSRILKFFHFFCWPVCIIIMLFLSIILGVIYHKVVEKPIIRLFNQKLSILFLNQRA